MGPEEHEARLAHDLLKSVSRSFYLTLRLLPGALRGPVSLAYLLARATDSVADAAALPGETRLEILDSMRRMIGSGDPEPAPAAAPAAARIRAEVIPALDHAGERALLEALPDCLAWLTLLKEHEQAAIRGVLEHIVRGQSLDVQRFPDAEFLRALATGEELDEYTYLVAGSVGGFWTELCVAELGEGCFLEETAAMAHHGIAFGKGLQLINVLRDIGEDFAAGRCYLPEEELGGCDSLENWLEKRPGKLTEVFENWSRRCGKYLEQGIVYVEHIRSKRLRYGTALPLLFAVRTLKQLSEADWDERLRGVKVSRKEVQSIMAKAAVASLQRGGIRKLCAELG